MHVRTIDCQYTGREGVAAAYLLCEPDRAAFVEANTTTALPHLLGALEAAGYRPEQVEYVIVTHIHLDHAGGAGALMAACPHATLIAHPQSAPHAIDPSRIVAGAREVYGEPTFRELYGEIVPVPAERVRAMDHQQSLALGDRTLTFLHTRGHANHHFVVHDGRTGSVFTGDSFGILYPALQRNGPFAFPSTTPTQFDPQAAHASVDDIVRTGAPSVFPTHMGEHRHVAQLADQLHRQLDLYAALVDEADRSGRDGAELDTFCATRVQQLMMAELQRHGLGSDTVARELVALDADLNAQGVAFLVRKRRHKRA